MNDAFTVFGLGALACFFAIIVLGLCDCATVTAERDAAESAYLAQQLRCVDTNNTKADIDTCRKKVREQWAVADAAVGEGGPR